MQGRVCAATDRKHRVGEVCSLLTTRNSELGTSLLSQRDRGTEKDFQLNHEGHEVHEGRAGFTTQLPQGRKDDDCLVENTQRVGVLPSCLSKAKEPLPGRGAETGRTHK